MHPGLGRTLLPVAIFALPPCALGGQAPDTVTLSPIVVTATRVPVPADAAAATVTVISGEALRALGISTVAEALRGVPGVTIVATGSFGGQTSLFLRGGESDYVKVLVDGVPQNEPGGFFDFANLGTEDIDRIEVVRGPVSVLYGSDAVSGVVQVITRSGSGRAGARFGFGRGSYGSEWGQGAASGGGDILRYALTAARHTTAGIYSFNNHYRRDLMGARLQVHPDSRTQASFAVRYAEGVVHFPTDAIGVPSDSNQRTSDRSPSLALELSRSLSSRIDLHTSAAYHSEESRYDDSPDSPGDTSAFCCYHSRDVVRRLVLGGRVDVRLAAATILTGGVELEQQRQGGTTLDTARRNSSVYAQALLGVGRSISLIVGGRVDDNQQFGRHATGRMGLSWRPDLLTQAHASVGSGFKEPSLFENFASGFARGNPALKPERSIGWELGLSRTTANGRVSCSIIYFDQRFRDLIQYSPAPVGADSTNYANLGDAAARGVELSASAALGGTITIGAAYTVLRSRDLVTGRRLARRPAETASVQLEGRHSRRGAYNVTARLTGARDDEDFATFPSTRVTLKGYAIIDASIEYRVRSAHGGAPGLRLTGRVANLLDRRYEEVVHFRSPRRTLLVGGELSLGGG